MTTPIIEHIAADIKTAINAITVAAGFNQTLTGVRPTRVGFEGGPPPKDLEVFIIQDDPDEDEDLSGAGYVSLLAWRQPFLLQAFVISSDDATASIDTRINQVRSDIEQKLMEDISRGGYAIDTQVKAPIKFNDGPAFSGIVVMIEVIYRTRENDPYTAAG